MKKTIILFLFAFVATLTSCFEDKGNYAYKEMGEIKIEGIEEKYDVISLKSHIDIPVDIITTMDGGEYDYMWAIHTLSSQGEKILDTLSVEKDLSYDVTLIPGQYRLVYKVQNKKNGLFKYSFANLNVASDFSDGWYVLKDNEDKTDMDLHSLNNSSVAENLIKSITGRSLEGEAQTLGYFLQFSWKTYQAPIVENSNKIVLVPSSKKESMMFNANVMQLIFDWENMFYGGMNGTPLFTIDDKAGTKNISFVSTNGIYAIDGMGPLGAGKFGTPLVLDKETLNPNKNYSKGNNLVLLFDEVKSRFVSFLYGLKLAILSDKKNDNTVGEMSPNEMNSDLVAMRPVNPLSRTTGNAYALMRKRDESKDFYLLKLVMTVRGSVKNPIESVTQVDKSLEVCTAKVYGSNFEVPFIYFSSNNVLNYFDCEMNKEFYNIKTFAADENIVFVRHLLYNPGVGDEANTFNYLAVGTHVGGKYKIYLYNILAGRPSDKPVRVLEGRGRAVDLQFISSKMVASRYAI